MGAWSPKHVEKVCSNKICILLHHVGVLFNQSIAIMMLLWRSQHFALLTSDTLFVYNKGDKVDIKDNNNNGCQNVTDFCVECVRHCGVRVCWQADSRTRQPVSTEYQHKTTGTRDIAVNSEARNPACPRLLGQSVRLLSRQGGQPADPTRWLRQAPSQWEVSCDATPLVENAL